MKKSCRKCNKEFSSRVWIDGKLRSLQRRKFCLDCSPFGSGNTSKYLGQGVNEKRRRKTEADRRWQQKARKERKQKLIDLLGGQCSKCGYKRCNAALDFHHLEDKNFGISNFGLCRSWEKLVKEVKKCILLCKNCHTEMHHNMGL